MGAAFGLFSGYSAWRGHGFWVYPAAAAAFFLALGLVFPPALKPIQQVWMTLALLIGWVMTRVLLGALFYLVLTPISFLSRLAGKQFLEMKLEKSGKSYWNYRKPRKFEKKIYEQQF